MATKCPICGNQTLESRHGEFRLDPPANIPGGVMLVQDAEWLECSTCDERILSPALSQAIELMRYDRLGLLRSAQIRAVREKTGLSQEAMAGVAQQDAVGAERRGQNRQDTAGVVRHGRAGHDGPRHGRQGGEL